MATCQLLLSNPKSQLLDSYQFSGLTDEATLIRVYLRRVIEMEGKTDTPYDPLTILRAICLGAANLNRLLKTQKLLFGQADSIPDEWMRALEDVRKEWTLE